MVHALERVRVRRHAYANRNAAAASGKPDRRGGGGSGPGGSGGGSGPGGPRGGPGGPDPDPSPGPFGDPSSPGFDPSAYDRFIADEDEADGLTRPSGASSPRREMSFIESVFAFVFGRGDPNDALEERRWRAIALLLRANRGAVFAEQIAPSRTSTCSGVDAAGSRAWDWWGVVAGFVSRAVRGVRDVLYASRGDRRRRGRVSRIRIRRRKMRLGASRTHEGYVLEVLAKFGGHAEASDDGKLVYVFPLCR